MQYRIRSVRLIAFIAAGLVISSHAAAYQGGSQADYARAESLPREVRGKVLNDRLDPQWLDGSTFIYRRQTGPESSRFLRVDAAAGERADAFDHDAVAMLLSLKLGREVAADALPIERIIPEDDHLLILIEDDSRVFRIGDDAIDEVPLDATTSITLRPTRARRSGDNGPETEVLFVNELDHPVTLFWLDQGGDRREYETVQPGGEHRQHTYANHVWSVEAADGDVVARFRAEARPSAAIISDDMPRPADFAGRRGRERGQDRDDGESRPYELFIRDYNAWLRHTETQEETPLTTDGVEDDPYTRRHWWSPDNTRLVVMRIKPAQRHTVYMIESAPDDQIQPKLHQHQYLKPGDEIDHPRPVLFDVERMESIPIDDALFPNPWSINDVGWRPDGSAFSFRYVQRGHEVVRVLSVDADSGSVTTIIDEPTETFIDYSQKTYFRRADDTDEIIWMSERSGWNHLYLIDASTGEVKNPITSGEWVVRAVEDVDEEARTIRFRAMGVHTEQDPYHVHHGRVKFDGTGLTWLTEGDGTHSINYSPDGGEFYIDTYSRVDMPPVHELRRTADGSLVMELAHADDSELVKTGWQRPERFVARGRDGETDIWGVIYRPSTFDPSVKYPVIEQIYAGPHGHHVPKSFRAWHGAQTMAELGFVLVQIDGMGTNWRSKAFHDVCWKNIGDAGFPDRIAWMKAAASDRPWMDLSRVGIYGGSAGGQNALGAVLAHGDFYDAAAADCGCHDNRMDKIWWNEAWMGWPIGDHYDEQSNVTMAHRLQGDLLLIVGELDRNVDPASTMQVVDALIRADKDFELIVVPGAGHGAGGGAYGRRRQRDFFVRNLLGVEPRWDDGRH